MISQEDINRGEVRKEGGRTFLHIPAKPMSVEEEIENLKQSAFTVSVAEESRGLGQVKYRSEPVVTLSLALSALNRAACA